MTGLLTYEDLAAHWGVSVRQAKRLTKKTGLEKNMLDLGHRTKRFRPTDLARVDARRAGEKVGGQL